MEDATFADPDLTTFCRLDGLGLQVTGQFLEPDRAVLRCRVADTDSRCSGCGVDGVARDSVHRRPSARTALFAVFHETPSPSAILATVRC